MVGVIFKPKKFMSSSISATASNPGSLYNTDSLQGSAKALGQNDFLRLLVTQIQFQDPMNPKSNTDMAAQMAQFTSLQQASQSTSSLAMLQAGSLIGNQVTLQVDSQNIATGLVSGIQMKNGTPQILVGDRFFNVSQILSVSPAPPVMPSVMQPVTPPAPTTVTTSGTTTY
jgi:flagellar basal-body rod modification protein FlgD